MNFKNVRRTFLFFPFSHGRLWKCVQLAWIINLSGWGVPCAPPTISYECNSCNSTKQTQLWLLSFWQLKFHSNVNLEPMLGLIHRHLRAEVVRFIHHWFSNLCLGIWHFLAWSFVWCVSFLFVLIYNRTMLTCLFLPRILSNIPKSNWILEP